MTPYPYIDSVTTKRAARPSTCRYCNKLTRKGHTIVRVYVKQNADDGNAYYFHARCWREARAAFEQHIERQRA